MLAICAHPGKDGRAGKKQTSESSKVACISWYEQSEPYFFEEPSFAPALQRVGKPKSSLMEIFTKRSASNPVFTY